jgi:acetyl esterase
MTLHPVVEMMMQAAKEANVPSFSDGTPEQARALMEAMRTARPPREIPPLAEVRDVTIPGAHAVPARIYLPLGETVGTIVYMHGGGWVLGNLDTSHLTIATLAAASHCKVVSVDYRLAPEHPYPAGLDDVMQAIAWAAEPGVPLLVAGDSAGGNLAAAAALRARAEGGPAIAGQLLIYPALDASLETDSHRENGTLGYILTSKDMVWFWDHYAGKAAFEDHLVAPTLAKDFAGLPPAFIGVASHDPLRDEGLTYGEQLRAAGVAAETRTYEGMVHGFAGFVGMVDVADRALAEMGAWAQGVAQRSAGG